MDTKQIDRAIIVLLIVIGLMMAFYHGSITLIKCDAGCEWLHNSVVNGNGWSPWVYRLLSPLFVELIRRLIFRE